jgi:hypothetical protein
VLLRVLSGSFFGPDSRAVGVPDNSPAGGVGWRRLQAAWHTQLPPEIDQIALSSLKVTPKSWPDAMEKPPRVNEIFPMMQFESIVLAQPATGLSHPR